MLDETPTINLPTGRWIRTIGNRWTTSDFRAPVIAWCNGFVATHNWTDAWEVTEVIGSRSPFVSRRRTAVELLAQDPNRFRERPGPCELVVRMLHCTRGVVAEIGMTFPEAHETTHADIAAQLENARVVFERQRAGEL